MPSQPAAPTPETAEEYLKRQEEEWGTYVAIQPIMHGGVISRHPGDPVPVSVVKEHKYDEQGLVAKRTTQAAKAVTGEGA